MSGATIEDITSELSKLTNEQIEDFDVTIVVCMLNAKSGQSQLSFAEMNGVGAHINALCTQLLRHKRPAIILGGNAQLWSFDEKWDGFVAKSIAMCRAFGIPTIDGVHYFEQFQLQEGGWHCVKTEENQMKICAMLEDTRNMLYAVWPHGCFAKLVAVPPTVVSMLTTGPPQGGPCPIPPQGGSVVVPPQEGPQASSSSSMPETYAQVIARNAPPIPSASVGWNSQPALWPPLAPRPTASKASRPAQPVKEPPAFRVKAQSQADRRQGRQQLGKAAAADALVDPFSDDPDNPFADMTNDSVWFHHCQRRRRRLCRFHRRVG